jgi:hypothetical protein
MRVWPKLVNKHLRMLAGGRSILMGLFAILPIALHCAQAQSLGKIDRELVDAVFHEICRLKIQQPNTVMRQAILETGWMRAPFLMKRQNLFGFKNSSYLSFNHWQDSVAFYKAWQDKYYKASEHKDYGGFLISIRYASAGYTDHLRQIQWTKPCPAQPSDALDPSLAIEATLSTTGN